MPCNPVDSTRLYGVTPQNIVVFIVTVVRASNSFVVSGPDVQTRGLFWM
jgi:hypothetical protein